MGLITRVPPRQYIAVQNPFRGFGVPPSSTAPVRTADINIIRAASGWINTAVTGYRLYAFLFGSGAFHEQPLT